MRKGVFLWGAILLLAASAAAQRNADEASLSATAASPAPVARATAAAGSAATSEPAPPQQGVYGVFENYEWQASVGYTFFRFYEVPGTIVETNGLDFSMVYYPGFRRIGADGEMVATFGSQSGTTAKFAAAMGGVRYRFGISRKSEIWIHGLAGGAHFLPQTALGSQSAFGYEAGVGMDFNLHRSRLAYRIQADVLGTRFFHTYQYSPKISAGIVFRY